MMNLKSLMAVAILATAIFSPVTSFADEIEAFPVFCQRVMDSLAGIDMRQPIAKAQLLNILNHSQRPRGEIRNYLETQRFIDTFSNVDLNENRIAAVLTVTASVKESQHVLEQIKHLSSEFQIGTDQALITIRPHGTYETTIEVPLAGVQQQVMSFMAAVEALRFPTNYELLDLGSARLPTYDAIVLGPQNLVLRAPHDASGMELRRAELTQMVETLSSKNTSSIVLQAGITDRLKGHSPFLVAVPFQHGLDHHISESLKTKVIMVPFESLIRFWGDFYEEIAQDHVAYLIPGNHSFFLVSSETFGHLDSWLREFIGSQGPLTYSLDLPSSLIEGVHSCLFCEVHFPARDGHEVAPRDPPADDRLIGERRTLKKPMPHDILLQSIKASEQARYALRESFPREMYTTDPHFWTLVNKILDRITLPVDEREKIVNTFKFWELSDQLDVQLWGKKISEDASRNFTKYLMLRVLQELSRAYKTQKPASTIDPEKIESYEETRKFLDELGFPKLVNPYKRIHLGDGEEIQVDDSDDEEEVGHQLAATVQISQVTDPQQEELATIFSGHDGSLDSIMVRIKPAEQTQVGVTKFFKRLASQMEVKFAQSKLGDVGRFKGRLRVATDLIPEIPFTNKDLTLAQQGNAPSAIRILMALELLAEVWKENVGRSSRVDAQNLHVRDRFETFMREIGF